MAALSDPLRVKLWRKFMESGNFPPTVLKSDLRAAINAADDWVDSNASSYNTALPQPFRGAATSAQKALILAYIALERAGV